MSRCPIVSPEPDPALIEAALALIPAAHDGLFVLGICGSQGSGKSTLAKALVRRLEAQGTPVAALSLDDLYLPRSERSRLAEEVHRLFATRGVPGTHDIALGLKTIAVLAAGEAARLPRFDKANDERLPEDDWPRAPEGCRVLVLEGWCLGARPQPGAALLTPVNALEGREDERGVWRRHANACLAGDYQQLFACIDALVLLAAPSFGVVERWRKQQEGDLTGGSAVMDAAAIHRFVQHYQRLTEWILDEMPERAHLVVQLDEERGVLSLVR